MSITSLDWLQAVPRQKLLNLCLKVTADCMSPGHHHGLDASQSSTSKMFSVGSISDNSDADSESETVVAARNVEDIQFIEAQLKMFVHELMSANPFNTSHRNWSFCMILWMIFLKDAKTVQESSVDQWLQDICRKRHIREEEMVVKVSTCLKLLHSSVCCQIFMLTLRNFTSTTRYMK